MQNKRAHTVSVTDRDQYALEPSESGPSVKGTDPDPSIIMQKK
jgi:hypothetical protein